MKTFFTLILVLSCFAIVPKTEKKKAISMPTIEQEIQLKLNELNLINSKIKVEIAELKNK